MRLSLLVFQLFLAYLTWRTEPSEFAKSRSENSSLWYVLSKCTSGVCEEERGWQANTCPAIFSQSIWIFQKNIHFPPKYEIGSNAPDQETIIVGRIVNLQMYYSLHCG